MNSIGGLVSVAQAGGGDSGFCSAPKNMKH